MKSIKDFFPIAGVTQEGAVISDNYLTTTFGFKLTMPIMFSLDQSGYAQLVESFNYFISSLGDDIIIHKQDRFHKQFFSTVSKVENMTDEDLKDFINRSYLRHFNERDYISHECFLFITKCPNLLGGGGVQNLLVSDDLKSFDAGKFLSEIETSLKILQTHGIHYEVIDQAQWKGDKSPIFTYWNMSENEGGTVKDISFNNQSIHVGSKEVRIHAFNSLNQFPTGPMNYCSKKNTLFSSILFPLSYGLPFSHYTNQFIYIPKQQVVKAEVDKRISTLDGFNVRGINSDALADLHNFRAQIDQLGLKAVYYHFNIMSFDAKASVINEHIKKQVQATGFTAQEITLQRKDEFLAGVPGNAVQLFLNKQQINANSALLLSLEAATFSILEENHPDRITDINGLKVCDRYYGIPFNLSMYEEPFNRGYIHSENTVMLSSTGGGKSYLANLILLSEYRKGAHIFCIDASFSYRLHCEMHNGVYLTFDDNNVISFNPFHINNGHYDEETINTIGGVINAITKKDTNTSRLEDTVLRQLIKAYYEDRVAKDINYAHYSFDDFYEFSEQNLPGLLERYGLNDGHFSYREFLFILTPFRSGESLGYLLNSNDPRIKNLASERFVVIDVQKIRENDLLFSVVSVLAMALFNQKISKLPLNVKKRLVVDEAWSAIASPKMAAFMKFQVKVIRKYGGSTFFISQELQDFLASDIIKESIINNSHVKIFPDMSTFLDDFEPIKIALNISNLTETKIRSLNKNKRKNARYKEACFVWGDVSEVYAIETPYELKAIFETDATEVGKILPQYHKYGVELTAINYAEEEREAIK